jgi:transcriptional regulator with XRE-family HTH domain
MAKKFRELVASTMSPESRARAEARARAGLAEMRLHELRRARELSQEDLAGQLDSDQGNVSRLEQQTDMYISTLRRYIEALGGSLEIVARFSDGDVKISQFHDLAKSSGR